MITHLGAMTKIVLMAYLSLFLCKEAQAKTFSAHVDKTTIALGDSIILTLEYLGEPNEEPDLWTLEQSFSILSRQTSHESSFINGNHQTKTSWTLEILPKNSSKTVTIPAIKLGNQSSDAIAIIQSAEKATQGDEKVSLSMKADREVVYINQELIVDVIIKTALSLRNASLSKLEVKDAIVEPLIEGERSEEVVQGIKYQIFRQRYAVYPSKVGSLEISPVIFKGIVAGHRQGGQGFRGFFTSGTPISSRSNQVVAKVKDVPKEFPKGHQFLPLKSLIVVEVLDDANSTFEVNKATTRSFEIKAKGTLASNLPAIITPSIENLQIYKEEGNKIQRTEKDGMEASAKLSHIYMPTAPGKILVPEQTIYWWDTDDDKLKTSLIRTLEIDVKGEALAKVSPTPPSPKEESEPPKNSLPETSKDRYWQIVAVVFFFLWLITVVTFLWIRKWSKKKGKEIPLINDKTELAEKVKAVVVACKALDTKTAYLRVQGLCAWADKHQLNLAGRDQINPLLRELEKALYYGNDSSVPAELLQKIRAAAENLTIPSPPTMIIAPLYPQ